MNILIPSILGLISLLIANSFLKKYEAGKQKYLTLLFIPLTLMLFTIPMFNYSTFGKWTFSADKAMEFNINQEREQLNCYWGMARIGNDYWHCKDPPCKTYNIEGKNCEYEGYTGKGFLGFTDFDTSYYVCEGYGRMPLKCSEYYNNREEWIENY